MATADTKRWRKARRTIPRDLSPLPESIPTPYKRVRAPDERAACCQDLLDHHHDKAAAAGCVITPNLKAHRKTRTAAVITAEDLNKLFYERDILLDKLTRRSDEVLRLRAALVAAAG